MTRKTGEPRVGRARLYASTKVIDPDKPKARRGRPRKGKNNSLALRRIWASPEGRAKMMVHIRATQVIRAADRKANPEKYSRYGIPHGYTRATAAPLWAEARLKADRFIQKMTDEGFFPAVIVPDSDEEKGKLALHEACVLALGPTEKQAKLAAIRTVLEYTRSKPESKSKLTVNTSEDWLAEIARS